MASVEIEDIGAIGAEISHTTGGIMDGERHLSADQLQRHNAIIHSPLDLQRRNFAL